jgi:hypothetical protein
MQGCLSRLAHRFADIYPDSGDLRRLLIEIDIFESIARRSLSVHYLTAHLAIPFYFHLISA